MSSQKRSWPYASNSRGLVLRMSSCTPAVKRWRSISLDRMPIEEIATMESVGMPSKQKSNVSGVPQHAVGIT